MNRATNTCGAVSGIGFAERTLTRAEIESVVDAGLAQLSWRGRRVLLIVPDGTRTAPIALMFELLFERLRGQVAQLDVLVALGTHRPMSAAALNALLGITSPERVERYRAVRLFNHAWERPETFAELGVIAPEQMEALSDGYLREAVHVRLNRLVLDYDRVMVVGPTFPHEVAGFSGGNKYFFPGIAGGDIIHFTHWLGALHGNVHTIGYRDTAVRRVINHAAAMIPTERFCCSLVVDSRGDLHGLYFGAPEDAFEPAVELSARVHVIYKPRPFRQVLSIAPPMYEDIWTAGKCMYKLEPVVADGGELIIYAPHVTEVSYTHGREIEAVGYHVRDYFVKQAERFRHVPGCIKAHSTHVKGTGSYEDGVETPRVTVTLATGISRERCAAINLGYRDPANIDIESYADREDEGVLLVRKAGEHLYRLRAE